MLGLLCIWAYLGVGNLFPSIVQNVAALFRLERIDYCVRAEDVLVHCVLVWLTSSPEINNSVNSYFPVM